MAATFFPLHAYLMSLILVIVFTSEFGALIFVNLTNLRVKILIKADV